MSIPAHRQRINVTLDKTMVDKLQADAKRERRAISRTVEIALEYFFRITQDSSGLPSWERLLLKQEKKSGMKGTK